MSAVAWQVDVRRDDGLLERHIADHLASVGRRTVVLVPTRCGLEARTYDSSRVTLTPRPEREPS